jgi:hypothetical protein
MFWKRKDKTKNFRIKFKDDPTFGEFCMVLDLLGVKLNTLVETPQSAISTINNLDLGELQDLMDLITVKKVNVRNYSLAIASTLVAYVTAAYLANAILVIRAQQLADGIEPGATEGASQALTMIAAIKYKSAKGEISPLLSEMMGGLV